MWEDGELADAMHNLWCDTCDTALEAEDSDNSDLNQYLYQVQGQGYSLSDVDGSSGVEDSDEDHEANAMPATLVEDAEDDVAESDVDHRVHACPATESVPVHISDPFDDNEPDEPIDDELVRRLGALFRDHVVDACAATSVDPVQIADHFDEWEERVEDFERSLPTSSAAVAARALPDCVAAMTASTLDRGEARDIKKHMDKHLAPAMPTVMPEKQTPREKLRAK